VKKIAIFLVAFLFIGESIYAQEINSNTPIVDSVEFPLKFSDLQWNGADKDPTSGAEELLITLYVISDEDHNMCTARIGNITVELRKDNQNFTSILCINKTGTSLYPDQFFGTKYEKIIILVPVAEDVAFWQEALRMKKQWFDEWEKYNKSLKVPRRIIPDVISRKQYAFKQIVDWGGGRASIQLHIDDYTIFIIIPLDKIRVIMRDDGVPATTITFTPKSASEASEATILAGSEGELISFSQMIAGYNRQWVDQQKKDDQRDHRQK